MISKRLLSVFAILAVVACGGFCSRLVVAQTVNPNSVPGTRASGLGGVAPLTLGTTVTANAIPARSRRSLFIYNQSTTATITVCTTGSGITPAPNVAGCYTLQPNGGNLAYPNSGYVPQDGYNAIASAANTPVTVEQH